MVGRETIDPPCNVIAAVCALYGVTEEMLRGKRRTAYLARVRQICAFLLRSRSGLSYPEIGHTLNRDHSTMIYACREIAARPHLIPDEQALIDRWGAPPIILEL